MADVALPVCVVPRADECSIRAEAERVSGPCCHRNDVSPLIDSALARAGLHIPGRDDMSVALEPDSK